MKRFLFLFVCVIGTYHLAMTQTTVTGTVTDVEGEALIGANILVLGTSVGTVTDFDGNYSVEVPEGSTTIRYSYTGFESQEVDIDGRSVIDVQLVAGQLLAEVVVTSLGIKRDPRDLTHSVSQLESEDLTHTKAVNVATAMVGKVSGMQINTINNGVKPDTRIVLRGNRSLLGNNQALIVVDGFPSSRTALDRLNPNDIASTTILKGANAAALYGSQATNGVVLIETKSGQKGLQIDFSSNYQMDEVSYMPQFQDEFGVGGFPDGTLWPLENVAWGPRYDGRMIEASETLDNGEVWMVPFWPIEDNHKNFFNKGSTFTNSLAFGGANDEGEFRLTLEHSNTLGVVPNDKYNRTNMRFKGAKHFDRISFGANFSFFRDSEDVVGSGGRQDRPVYWNVINTPLHLPMTELKNWRTGKFTRNEVSFFRFYENPYFIVDTQREGEKRTEFTAISFVDLKITDWFTATYRAGYTGGLTNFKRKFGAYTYAFHLEHTYSEIDPYGARTRRELADYNRFNGDLILQFDKDWDSGISTELTLGQNTFRTHSGNVNVEGSNLFIPEFYNVSTRTGDLLGGEEAFEYSSLSGYGELRLGYNDFIHLTVSGRNDWSSTLPASSRSYFYPSAGLAFIATEAFPALGSSNGLNYLKLTMSYAKTGNDPGIYAINNTFSATGGFPYGSIIGLSQGNRDADPALNPEFTTSLEAGVELGFLDDRLTAKVVGYKTNSVDQIVAVNISTASGASQSLINIGELENKGIEIDLNSALVARPNFFWDIGVNYAANRSEVLSLADGVDELDIGGYSYAQIIAKVGSPYPVIRTTAYERDPQGRVIVGDNGNPLQSSDLKIQGKTSPDYIVGATTSVGFGGLNLYVSADYRTGHVFFNDIVNALEFTGLTQHSVSSGRGPFVFPNSVYKDEAGNYVPNTNRLTTGGGNAFWDAYSEVKENYVTDASFLKIREIALGYEFNRNFFGNLPVQGVELSVYGRNVLTFRPADNVYTDPEFNFTTGNAVGVGTQAQTPPLRSYGIALNVNF